MKQKETDFVVYRHLVAKFNTCTLTEAQTEFIGVFSVPSSVFSAASKLCATY